MVGEFPSLLDPTNLKLSRIWYERHRQRFLNETDFRTAQTRRFADRAALGPALLALIDKLKTTGDAGEFVEDLRVWSVHGPTSFNGPTGQMVMNQLAKHSTDDDALARVLLDVFEDPVDDDQAGMKIQSLLGFIGSHTGNARIPLNNIPFVLSYFWAFQSKRYPTIWPSAASLSEYCTGLSLPKDDPVQRYQQFLALVRDLETNSELFLEVASWWWETKPLFLDQVLVDRSRFGGVWPSVGDDSLLNARAMVRVSDRAAKQLVGQVSKAVGRSLTTQRLPEYWVKEEGQPRGDLWIDWRDQGHGGMGIRIWINQEGASIGLRPGRVRPGWVSEVVPFLESTKLPGYRLIGGRQSKFGDDVGHRGGDSGDVTYAKWYDPQALSHIDLATELDTIAAELRPLLDHLSDLADGITPGAADSEPLEQDPLTPLVQEFRDRGYPTPVDEEDKADRAQFEVLLAPDAIALADPIPLRAIWNTGRYGGTGPMSVLNTSIRDADPDELDRILETLRFVCWGDDEGPSDSERIDEVLDTTSQRYVRGLGESVTMKLLAICHPDQYLLIYPFAGPKGKKAVLGVLELPVPTGATRGQQQVEANDALKKRLDRFFPGDLLGMSKFLYWLLERGTVAPTLRTEESVDDSDPIADLAEELQVDETFLNELVSLLRQKGQIILYGPPGTGKTYLARKLAEVLTEDATRRSLVQFHPSTSYEDFFEGYRPETSADGVMTYRLTPGPLALLAARSADSPGKPHVMIIDEINRANLPKVLGELLFLLEYRDERVRTLYRPEDAFELPKDLWFIGTMNTADRSIALVDAAMRRRFFFVPFFPNEGPMEGLLDRWLAKNHEPAWIGTLVTMVNDDLIKALGGPHLQLGPSYFMQKRLDEAHLKRIWRYSIEPFIEDQFFGDSERIAQFRFAAVFSRFQNEFGPLSNIASEE